VPRIGDDRRREDTSSQSEHSCVGARPRTGTDDTVDVHHARDTGQTRRQSAVDVCLGGVGGHEFDTSRTTESRDAHGDRTDCADLRQGREGHRLMCVTVRSRDLRERHHVTLDASRREFDFEWSVLGEDDHRADRGHRTRDAQQEQLAPRERRGMGQERDDRTVRRLTISWLHSCIQFVISLRNRGLAKWSAFRRQSSGESRAAASTASRSVDDE